jgi:hypothetical protein
MAFPKSVPACYIVRRLANAGKSVVDLLPFEFAAFNEDTHLAIASGDVNKQRRVYFAVGSPNVSQFNQGTKQERHNGINNSDLPFLSQPVTIAAVDRIRAQDPVVGDTPNVYYLGFNGIDTCNSLKFECGKTYTFNVQLKGRPVRNIFGREMQQIVELETDCCEDCASLNCGSNCTVGADCHLYLDKLVERFNAPDFWVSRFYKAEKVQECTPALPALTTTTFNKYCLTVCDNGDEVALSSVQNTYPTSTVTVKERNAPYTTYEIIKTGAAPSAFTQSNVILSNCNTCPSGYTYQASGYAYIVEIDNNRPEIALTAVQAVWATATSATLIRYEDGSSEYYVVSSAPLANPAVTVDAIILQNLGRTDARCTQTTVSTTNWVLCGTTYKVQRDLCLTISVDDCDVSGITTLQEMTTYYANNTDVVAGTLAMDSDSTNCILRFTISQRNNAFLTNGCDTYAVAEFNDLPTFKGQRWDVCPCIGWTVNAAGCPVPPVPTDRCCQCGIKFTGLDSTIVYDRFSGYDINEYLEKDPVELNITVYRDDNGTNICDPASPTFFHAQRASFRQLRGDDVIKEVIMSRFYEKELWVNQISKENQLFLQREGIKLGVDLDAYYFAVDIYHNTLHLQNNTASASHTRQAIRLFIHESDVTVVAQIKSYLAGAFPMAKLEQF